MRACRALLCGDGQDRELRINIRLSRAGKALLVGVLATSTATAVADAARAAVPSRPGTPQPSVTATWQVDLNSAAATLSNISHTSRGLTLAEPQPQPHDDGNPPTVASRTAGQPATAWGSYTALEVNAGQWVSAVIAKPDLSLPAGTHVEIDVRGRGVDDSWTQWRTTRPGSVVSLPEPVSRLQARITLTGAADGTAPIVSGLELQSVAAPAEAVTSATELGPVRLFATREDSSATPQRTVTSSSPETTSSPYRRVACWPRMAATNTR